MSPLASESDPYTYSSIPLADSAPLLNPWLNRLLEATADDVNRELPRLCASADGCDDTRVEIAFAEAYKQRFLPTAESRIISEIERCIGTNDCPGWPWFERIQLLPGESVFDRSQYSYLTVRILAEVVNVCGVRMGTDKLTHLLADGFAFYNLAMEENGKFHDPENLERWMLQTELRSYGKMNTSVVSHADIEANRQGVRFFRSLLHGADAPFVRNLLTDRLSLRRPVDLCEFVNPNYDERVLQNEFTGKNAEALLRVIQEQNRIEADATWTPEAIARILERRSPHSIGAGERVHSALKLVKWGARHPGQVRDFLELVSLPIPSKNRVPTRIPRVLEDPR